MSKKETKETKETVEAVHISPPNFKTGVLWIIGTAPLVMHKFSEKAKNEMRMKQERGSAARNTKREAKDFNERFNESRHISFEGWDGIPAMSFKAACIDACQLAGFTKTESKKCLFVIEEGYDRDEGTPLVRIIGGEPRRLDSMVRIGGMTKTADIAVRAQWIKWGAKLYFRYDADRFNASDIVNLVNRAGIQCGVCEGRPSSKNSVGMGWGTFRISSEEEVMALEKKGANK